MAGDMVLAAARKIKCPPRPMQTTLATSKVVKSKASTRSSKKYPKALQRPAPPPEHKPSVRIQVNGLVDIARTPDYLVETVALNDLESPLLRLPASVRMKIWEFAMGGHTVEIKLRQTDGMADQPFSSVSSTYRGYSAFPGPPGRKIKKLKTAFHLPEVCRRIYRETATLGYALNTFVFVGELPSSFGMLDAPDGALEGWALSLIPAQWGVVGTIRPHWRDIVEYVHRNDVRAFKMYYPSLKKVVVAKRAVNFEVGPPTGGNPSDPMQQLLRKAHRDDAKNKISARIKEIEGDDVEVVF